MAYLKRTWVPAALILALLLSACQGLALSAEAAATRLLLEETTPGLLVDEDSLEVRNQLKVEDGPTLVALTFDGRRGLEDISCFYIYQVEWRLSGWRATSGGGSCRPAPPIDPGEGMQVVAGHTPGARPGEKGITQVYGWVDDPAIARVRVVWEDGVMSEVEVVDGTLLAVRRTDGLMRAVEGLDEQGGVIHTSPGR